MCDRPVRLGPASAKPLADVLTRKATNEAAA